MGILFSHNEDGDYTSTTGRGKNRKTVSHKGGWDKTSQRNFATGPKDGCVVSIVAGLLAGASVIPTLADIARTVT